MKVDDRRAHGPNPRHARDALPRRPKSRRPVFSPDRASAHRAAPARRGARVSNDSFTVLLVRLRVVASIAYTYHVTTLATATRTPGPRPGPSPWRTRRGAAAGPGSSRREG